MFNKKITMRLLSALLVACMVMSIVMTADPKAITVNAVTDSVLLENSDEANYEKLTFSDFGVADGEILNHGSGHFVSSVLEGDLDEILFQGKFLFPTLEQSKKFGNIYIGLANWWGLTLSQDSNGNILVNATSTGSTIENPAATNLTVNSHVELRNNPDLELAFSVKYENKTASTTDLKIGVWINGVLQSGGYIIIKNAKLSELTRCFHTYDVDANSSVTVASVTDVPVMNSGLLSESVENDYEKLTFADFGIADGEILNQGSGHFVSSVLEGDLDEILFQGKFLFPTLEQSKKFGNIYIGLANWWGLTLSQDSNGNILVNATSTGSTIENPAATNLTVNSHVELRNNPDLELAFSVKYENKTASTTDLKIGVWINGVLQSGGYIIIKNAKLSELTRCFHTYDVDANSSVTVASVGQVIIPEPEDVLLSESEEKDYENLTFGSFGIADGQILNQENGYHFITATMNGDLNEVLFRGKYLFPTVDTAKQFGNIYIGKAKYYGIVLMGDSTGNILLDVITSATNKSAVENTNAINLTANSQVELRNNPDLEIAISVKYENTTAMATDLKIGVWINGKLQKGGYIYARNVVLSDLTRCLHTYDTDANSSVIVSSVGEVKEPEKILLSESEAAGYEKLTFGHFGVKDGQIATGKSGEKITYAMLPGSLDRILFQGKYNFPSASDAKKFANIYIGRPDWWAIGLTQDGAGNMMLSVISDGSSVDNINLTDLTNGNPNIQFRENGDLEIAISVKYENTTLSTTDLVIGVWINGILQQGDYIYARNVQLDDLVRCLHVYDVADGCGVGVASVGEWEIHTLPTDFTDITLSDANIPDGNKVTYGNLFRIDSLNKTLFSAYVQFNAVGSRLHFGSTGGGENAYSGLGLRLEKNGTLVLGNELESVEGLQPNELASIGLNFFTLNPTIADMGDTFAGKKFLLQISTEFVDFDGDGEKNDIKLGVFIDGNLYCNSYIYIANEAQTLGTGVNFNGVNEVDFARFSSVVLKELTTTDLGINNGSYDAVTHGNSSAATLDRTSISAYVTFSGSGSVAYGSAGKGIVLTYKGDNMVTISHIKADNTVVVVGQVQIPGDCAVELRITFEYIKVGTKQTNLKLGVFVNGKLSGYKYFIVEDVDVSVLTRSMVILPSDSVICIGANSYEGLTLRDFMIADKTRSDYGGRYSYFEGANYNNTAFSAELTFSDETLQKNDNCFYIGGREWYGLRAELDTDGNLLISFVHTDGIQMNLARISPEDAGMSSFQGKSFTYRVTFDVIESAEGQMDAVIGVYINGKLCNDKHLLVKGIEAVVMERGLFSYVDKNGGSLTMKSTNPTVDFTIFGFTSNWENTLGIQ